MDFERMKAILTPREMQVAQLVAQGACNKLIADRLSISECTVKAHLSQVFKKMTLPNRVALALYMNDIKF